MPSVETWWWVLRQAFGIPDLVRDEMAKEAIVSQLVHAAAAPATGLPPASIDLAHQKIRADAELIPSLVCSLGAAGFLDDVLLGEPDRDLVVRHFGRGELDIVDARQMIDRALDRVGAWVKANPDLPAHLREYNPPPRSD